ncbi:hypothetical protein [Dokdonella sp.]|uniref:hypothetical protein n=1 Tax=Dokdonella sp. TaxID=2291710 RepID=UPI002F40EFD7
MRYPGRAFALLFACAAGLSGAAQTDLVFSSGFESETCTTNAECGFGKVCAAGFCRVEGSLAAGAPCSANRDCHAGLFCSATGVCASAGGGQAGESCSSGGGCTSDLACALYGLGGTCSAAGAADLGGACTATADCIAGLACSPAGLCTRSADAFPPFAGVACAGDPGPFRVYFEVPRPGHVPADFFRLPFPNDARIEADGTLDLADFPRAGSSVLGFDIADRYADVLSADFAGFSAVTGVTFRFSAAADPASLGEARVHFVDITDVDEPAFGSDRARSLAYHPERRKYACENTLTVSPLPGEPLRPGGIYAAYVDAGVRSATGAAPVQDPDLAAMLAASAPSDPTLARAWTRYAHFRAFLQVHGLAAADVAGASVLQVEDASRRMLALQSAVDAQPPPVVTDLTVCDGTTPSPCAIAGDPQRVCGDSSGSFWEVQGRLTIPAFQQGTAPYETPGDGGAIVFDAGGAPVQSGTLAVCFALSVPKSAPPPQGWPLVVHAHGTGGSFRSAIADGIAAALATAASPMATLTVEGVAHGARRGASTRPLDGLVFNVINPRATVGNHLQGAADVLQALRFTNVAFTLPGGGNVSFDPAHVYFFGHSQGANVGIPALAVSSRAPAAILSGAGSQLGEGWLSRTRPSDAAATLAYLLDESSVAADHPLLTLWQTFFDGIDPVNFDPLLLARPPAGVASKHVFMAWGESDTYTPAATTDVTVEAAALQLGAPVIEAIPGVAQVARPVTGNVLAGDGVMRTAACFQYAPDPGDDGHFVSTRNAQAVQDWVAFLVSLTQTGTPTVP